MSLFDEIPAPTRTTETVSFYIKRAKTLARRAKESLNLSEDESLDPRQFVAWLDSLRPTLSRPSWRQYKSAVACFLEQIQTKETAAALDYLRQLDTEGCVKNTTKTSGSKLKKFSWKDFQKITDYLRRTPGKWHNSLLDWLISSYLTGLRPQEWAHAKITKYQDEVALEIQNAKGTNGRSHGPTRTLLLSALSQDELQTLRNHLERVQIWAGMDQFDDFYSSCSITLYYVCRKLWPRRQKHLTLYSCRHQFSANAKASGFSTVEIAAMMGHKVDTTATLHYGKKTAGQELLRVRAIDEDIQKIEQKFKPFQGKRVVQEPMPKPKNISPDPLG